MKHDDDEDTQNANHKLGKIFSLHPHSCFFLLALLDRERKNNFIRFFSSTLLLSLCNVEGEERRWGGKRYIYVFCSFVTK